MTKKFFLIAMAALLSASLFFLGCQPEADDDDPLETTKSDNAGLATGVGKSVVKGVPVGAFGTGGDSIANARTVSVEIPDGTANGEAATTFTAADTKARVDVVFVADGTTVPATVDEFETALADPGAFTNGSGDPAIAGMFLVRVTAENGKVLWHKIAVIPTIGITGVFNSLSHWRCL
jgi:hypothetical protein